MRNFVKSAKRIHALRITHYALRNKDTDTMTITPELRLCTRCVLPETFPGIKFDEQGVCNYCHRALTEEKAAAHRANAHAKFLQVLDEVRGRGPYDVLVGWSGGKDSTYILARLVKE